jgi:DNA-binding transcriptional LysR family regulator
MTDLDLNLLIALDALLAEGSVAGAARRLSLSASAMSRTLARLRAATGDPLLVRAGRDLVPTPHAKELSERVRYLAQEVQAVLRPPPETLDIENLERVFTIRANEGFVDLCAASLVTAARARASGVRLRFAPKPDKNAQALREGLTDLEIGVIGETGPELRVQRLFGDGFVGVVRTGHPLIAAGRVTPENYASCDHVVASRHGRAKGPVDDALATLGLERKIAAVVPGFPAAVQIARVSDLVALVTRSFMRSEGAYDGLRSFRLPVTTPEITISQIWHPRMDADPGHRWLRQLVRDVCRDIGRDDPSAALPDEAGKT